MEKNVISEESIKGVLMNILSEETSKVKRDEFNKVQFKIEELENSLSETLKELRKLVDSIPDGLKTVCNGRIKGVSSNLNDAQRLVSQLKKKVREHKKSLYSQQVEEKKK
jgi:hypothetical protein